MHSPFRQVVLKCIFHVQIKQSCKSERLVAFFWCGRDQKGPGGAEIHIFDGLKKEGDVGAPGEVYS